MVFSNLESTNLEKVTVKSLDEIKREKEQRQLGGSAHQATRHDSLQAGGSAEDGGEDRNLFGKIPIDYRHLKSDFCHKNRDFFVPTFH